MIKLGSKAKPIDPKHIEQSPRKNTLTKIRGRLPISPSQPKINNSYRGLTMLPITNAQLKWLNAHLSKSLELLKGTTYHNRFLTHQLLDVKTAHVPLKT